MESEEIIKKIDLEIEKTLIQISEFRTLTKPIAPDVAIGRISRMDAINNKSVSESALRQAEEKLDRLKFVKSKVGTPDFGICLKCRKEIPLGRVLIRPQSVYCVHCAK
jgi:DnaK suppressor protein